MINIPFNYNPVDNIEDSASYTVGSGSGDYALMLLTVSVESFGTIGGAVNGASSNGSTSDSNSASGVFPIKNGAVITKTETAASATTGALGAGAFGHTSSTGTCAILVDGVAVIEVSASATAWTTDNGAATAVATVTGTAKATWGIAEFNSIS